MNILMLTPDYPDSFGGIGEHVYNLLEMLNKIDVQNKFYIFLGRLNRPLNYETKKCKHTNIEIIEFDIKYKNNLLSRFNDCAFEVFNKEYKAIEKFEYNLNFVELIFSYLENNNINFTLIHSQDAFSALVAVTLKSYLQIPLITTVHALTAPNNFLIDSLRRYQLANSDRIIAISNHLKFELINRYNIPENRIQVIYNGVEVFNKYHNRVCNQRYITFCGRLSKLKGVDILIKAFSEIICLTEFNDLRLKIIGDGEEKNNFIDLAVKLNIRSYIDFEGYLPHDKALNVISMSLVHVVPSLYESFGLSAIEAMSLKIPVVSSNVGGLSEFVVHNVSGIQFDLNDIKSLTTAILFVLKDEENTNRIVDKAYKLLLSKYSWENIAKQTYELYKNING